MTRITATGASAQSLAAAQSAAYRLTSLRRQLSSGRRITTSSDDPDGTVTALGLRSALARSDHYGAAATDALAWLATADSAYSQSLSTLQSARTLAARALSSGVSGSAANTAAAAQVDGLRSTLLSLANSACNGRPVFGGTTSGAIAYDASGTYVGDTGTVSRIVATRFSVDVGAIGTGVFGTGDTDIFAELREVASSLRTDPISLASSALDRLDSAIARIGDARASAAGTYQQVQRVTAARIESDADIATRLNDIEEIDLADIALRTAAASASYRAALQTTAQVDRRSLLDFLR